MVAGCILWALLLWAELFGFYLLSAGHVGMAEMLACGPVALAAAAGGLVLHRRATRRARHLRVSHRWVPVAIFGPLPHRGGVAERVPLRVLARRQRRV